MTESYRIVYTGGSGEIVEKKSRFIADIRPVSTEEEALAFIEEIRKKYWDARHHCYAYILGERGQYSRCSDDGEPSQTAGRPMLDVLAGEELTDVCAVVTRYFGGTLLGTGGLVRAYSGAVKEGLSHCVLMEKRLGKKLSVTVDYADVGKVQYLAAQAGIDTLDTVYEADVRFQFLVPIAQEEAFGGKLTESTAGRARIIPGDLVYYGAGPEGLVVF